MLLSDRMQAVAGLVSACRCMADIGCDHGYVAMELIRSRTCRHVIAMDINEGPLKRASHNIKEYDMADYIETRLSDGTKALAKNEADGIVCAGMGGRLIISILEQGKDIIAGMKQLILQPQSEVREVREYLRKGGFCIEKEDMVREGSIFYPMMRVIPVSFGRQELQMADNLQQKCRKKGDFPFGSPYPPAVSEISGEQAGKLARIQDTYGPYLLQKAHPVLKQYLLWQKENLENIRDSLINQDRVTPRQQERIAELDTELGDIVFCLYNFYR